VKVDSSGQQENLTRGGQGIVADRINEDIIKRENADDRDDRE
jgi:hypothetical protein